MVSNERDIQKVYFLSSYTSYQLNHLTIRMNEAANINTHINANTVSKRSQLKYIKKTKYNTGYEIWLKLIT